MTSEFVLLVHTIQLAFFNLNAKKIITLNIHSAISVSVHDCKKVRNVSLILFFHTSCETVMKKHTMRIDVRLTMPLVKILIVTLLRLSCTSCVKKLNNVYSTLKASRTNAAIKNDLDVLPLDASNWTTLARLPTELSVII